MWGSTDNLNEWVLSFHQVDLGVKLGLADLVGKLLHLSRHFNSPAINSKLTYTVKQQGRDAGQRAR